MPECAVFRPRLVWKQPGAPLTTVFLCNEPTFHCHRTLRTSAGICATADDEFLFVRRRKVLQKAAATKRPHRFHRAMSHIWCLPLKSFFFLAIEPASVVGKHQQEDMIPLAYWMYQNTEPDIQVSAEFSPCASGWIYLLIAGIFWKEGPSRMCVPPSPGRNRYSRWGWRWEEASCDEREKGKGIGNRRARLRREG